MKKYFLFGVSIFALILIGAGCGTSQQEKQTNTQQNQRQKAKQNSFMQNDNLEDANIGDLAIDTKIMVMGEINSDGSITATNIIIGDFSNMANFARPQNDESEASVNTMQIDTTVARERFRAMRQNGQAPDFQNMSEEERQAFRDQMAENRGVNSAGFNENSATRTNTFQQGRQIVSRVTGEIIDITDSIITVKISDGGSKLIFYSSETIIKKIKENNI